MKTLLTSLILVLAPLAAFAGVNGYNIPPLAAYNSDIATNVTLVTATNLGNTYLSNNVAPLATISNPTNAYVSATAYTNGNFRSLLFGAVIGGTTFNYTNGSTAYVINVTNTFCIPLSPNETFSFASGTLTNCVNWQ